MNKNFPVLICTDIMFPVILFTGTRGKPAGKTYGKSLPFVNIFSDYTNSGTTTDYYGTCILPDKSHCKYSLRLKYIFYSAIQSQKSLLTKNPTACFESINPNEVFELQPDIIVEVEQRDNKKELNNSITSSYYADVYNNSEHKNFISIN